MSFLERARHNTARWKAEKRAAEKAEAMKPPDTLPEKVYVVKGTSGEYSDAVEWQVAAYFDRDRAEEHVSLLNDWAKRAGEVVGMWDDEGAQEEALKGMGVTEKKGRPWGDAEERLRKVCPYDADPYLSYSGTHYVVVDVPLVLHVDQYQDRVDGLRQKK